MFKTILVCSDGSEHSVQAARFAVNLARPFHADVALLSVLDFSSLWASEKVPPTVACYGNEVHAEVQRRTGRVFEEAK